MESDEKRKQYEEQLKIFVKSEEENLHFPNTLSNDDRKVIHALSEQMGLHSISKVNSSDLSILNQQRELLTIVSFWCPRNLYL